MAPRRLSLAFSPALALSLSAFASAQPGTIFTYQGVIENDGAPISGTVSLRFSLHDDPTSGGLVGSPSTIEFLDVAVTNGLIQQDLDFGSEFYGPCRWLGIEVDEDGGDDAFVPLSSRIRINPTPYAMHAETAAYAQNDAVDDADANPYNELQFLTLETTPTLSLTISDGNTVDLTPFVAGSAWALQGNSGTTDGIEFLGTTDSTPLTLRVDSTTALRLLPAVDIYGNSVANVILGSDAVEIEDGAAGVIVSGGDGNGYEPNSAFDDRVVVLGGSNNVAGFPDGDPGQSTDAAVLGGYSNAALGPGAAVVGGYLNAAFGEDSGIFASNSGGVLGNTSAIVGGIGNIIFGDSSVILGGEGNLVSCNEGAVVAGYGNTSGACDAVVIGGEYNEANGDNSAVIGGTGNTAETESAAAIGGMSNSAEGERSATIGGFYNWTLGTDSVTLGGSDNYTSATATIAAGVFAEALHDNTFVWSDGTSAPFSSTAPGQFLIEALGGVGINNTAPAAALDVNGAARIAADIDDETIDPSGFVLSVSNTATTNNNGPDVLRLSVETEDPDATSMYALFVHNGSPAGAIQGNGTGGVEYTSAGSDFAEYLPSVDPMESIRPGDVVGIHGGRMTRNTVGADWVMAASSTPAFVGNTRALDGKSPNHPPVAFMGQIPVRVVGPVAVGDYIVASGRQDGTAIAVSPLAIRPEQSVLIVGRAWSASDDVEEKLVNTVVGLPESSSTTAALQRQVQELRSEQDLLKERLATLERLIQATP